MKILRISRRCGSSCGQINLNLHLEGVDLENGQYILSLRDEIPVTTIPYKNNTGSITLGEARARLIETIDSGGRRWVKVSIESADTQDFVDLCNKVYERLGIEHENIPRPRRRLEDISFVSGVRNDIHRLRRFLVSQLRYIVGLVKGAKAL